jgi:Tol biopolymer transport system component
MKARVVMGAAGGVIFLAAWLAALQPSSFISFAHASSLHQSSPAAAAKSLALPEEKRLRNVRQLTLSGENAEAYFSADDRRIIFQSHDGEGKCDQIYTMELDGSNKNLVSTGRGRTTCAFFFPDGKRILFSSTHDAGPNCPAPPDYSRGYVWKLHPEFEIYVARADGSGIKRLTNNWGYDAEATISRDGKKIVFTSMRHGDVDVYVMDSNGRSVKRLTHEPGYDGGPFFSPDGAKIVYRAAHPQSAEEQADYEELLRSYQLRPTRLAIYVMNADGSGKRKLTDNAGANFAPFFHPDGKRIIFASNMADPRGRNFDLYLVNLDGTGLERVTYHPDFDSFPMFSSDGKLLLWASNRNQAKRGDTNIFLAEWVE